MSPSTSTEPEPPLIEAASVAKRFPECWPSTTSPSACAPGRRTRWWGRTACKSTLLKVLTGVHRPDAGDLRLRGEPVAFGGPLDAQRAGIQAIHQEIGLVPLMSVARNLLLGREPRGRSASSTPARCTAAPRSSSNRTASGWTSGGRCAPTASGRSRWSRSPGPCRWTPASSSWTSRPAPSNRARSRPSSASSATCRPRASRSSTSATGWTSCSASATASPSCATAGWCTPASSPTSTGSGSSPSCSAGTRPRSAPRGSPSSPAATSGPATSPSWRRAG